MDKLYKDQEDKLWRNPILANHEGLEELTQEEFDAQLAINSAAPELTPLQLRNTALANIIYTRPSDGAEIQIRHPDYASDYIMINSAISRMEPLETRVWIKVDNIPTLVSKEDLEAVVAHGVAEVDRIFSEYFVALGGA